MDKITSQLEKANKILYKQTNWRLISFQFFGNFLRQEIITIIEACRTKSWQKFSVKKTQILK